MTEQEEDEYWNNMHDQYGTCSECGQPLCGCCGVCHQCQDQDEENAWQCNSDL